MSDLSPLSSPSPRRGRRAVAAACVLVLVLAAAGGWYWKGRAAAPDAAAPGSRAGAAALVTLASVTRQDVPVSVQVNGSVVSLNSVEVRPQVSNTIRTVHVKEGQFVKAGQLLFSLDDRADQANLQKAQAQLQKDRASLADLERQYRRSQELVAQNFIAKSAADTTLSQLEGQKATVAADLAAINSAQVALGYGTLRAPIAGRIGAITVFPGSLVTPAAGVVTVTQLDPIAVSFPVPEGHLQDLLAATRSRLPLTARVPGRAEPLTGTLDFVDNTVDPLIGTVRAKAVFPNADQGLWPGQFVETQVTVRTLPGAAVVPAAALLMLPNGTMVYVVDGERQATQRKVQVLHNFGTQVAVSGLSPGEQVVVEGKQNVRPGGKVRSEGGATRGGAGKEAPLSNPAQADSGRAPA
ncbi:MAG: efflux RND transporter periplasmic adaptor subunit [Pseudomonadota bacterium]